MIKIAVTAGGSTLLLAALWLWPAPDPTWEARSATPGRTEACFPVAGRTEAWRFRAEISLRLAEGAEESRRSREMVLYARALRVRADRSLVAFLPQSVRLAEASKVGDADQVERPFLAWIGARCRLLDVARHEAASPAALSVVQRSLEGLDFVLPEPGIERYVARHRDPLGEAMVGYQVAEARPLALTRRTLGYLGDDRELGYEVLSSGTRVERDDQSWFAQILRRNSFAGRLRGRRFVHIEEALKASRHPVTRDPFEGRSIEVARFVWGRAPPVLKALPRLSAEAARARLRAEL